MSKLFSKPKALLSAVLVLCMVVSMLPLGLLSVSADAWDGAEIAEEFAGGSGDSANDPILIETGAQLAKLAQDVNNGTNYAGKYIKLIADIDLGNKAWTRIGDSSTRAFTGTFDGDGHTISNLYLTGSSGYNGLFGYAAATIKNLSIINAEIDVTKAGAAGFIAYATGNVTMTDCLFSGDISVEASADSASTAAFIGGNWAAGKITLNNCIATDTNITVTRGTLTYDPQSVGGLVATAAAGTDVTFNDCSFDGSINGGNGVGGMIGSLFYGNNKNDPTVVTITNSCSTGTIYGGSSGGLVGYLRTEDAQNATDKTEEGLAEKYVKKIELYINDSYSTATLSKGNGLVAGNYRSDKDYLSNIKVEIKNSFFAGSAVRPIVNVAGTMGTLVPVLENVYYLAGSATTASDFSPAATCEKGAVAFADGTVVALLNAGRDVWKQGQNHPVLVEPQPPLASLTVGGASVDLTKYAFSYAQTVKSDVTNIAFAATPAQAKATIAYSAVDDAGYEVAVQNGVVALAEGRTTTITMAVTYKAVTTNYVVNVYREPVPWDGSSMEVFDKYTDSIASTTKTYEIANAKQFYFFARLFNEGTRGTTTNNVCDVTFDVDGDGVAETYKIRRDNSSWKQIFSGATIKLTADIDLANHSFPVIGSSSLYLFSCTIDGGGHEIKGLNISSSNNNTALFAKMGYVPTIKDLTVRGSVAATGTRNNPTGGIVAEIFAGGNIINCAFIGDVSGKLIVGGLLGYANPDTAGSTSTFNITNCYTAGTITARGDYNNTTANAAVGGLVGRIRYNSAADNGTAHHGGLINFTNCYSTMNIVESDDAVAAMKEGKGVGGLLGQYDSNPGNVVFDDCYFAGNVCSTNPIAPAMSGTQYATADKTTTVTVDKVTIQNGVYYKEGSYEGTATGAGVGDSAEYTAEEFANGTVADQLGDDWSTWAGVPVYGFAPTFNIDGVSNFNPATENYSVTSNGTVLLSMTNVADGTKVVVSSSKASALSVVANNYTVTTNAGETITLTCEVRMGKLVSTYIISIVDPRWDGVATVCPSGSGTAASPYLIGTPAELAYVSENIASLRGASKYFKLTADIDLGGYQWTPIGHRTWKEDGTADTTTYFWGTFDGDGHTIKGLYYNDTVEGHPNHDRLADSGGIGLFGRITPGYNTTTIKNLHVEGTIISSMTVVGGIVGYANGGVTNMENCSFSGVVRSGAFSYSAKCGGLIGTSLGTLNMTNCYTTGEVTGQKLSSLGLSSATSGYDNPEYIGGLVGQITDAADSNGIPKPQVNITNCYSTASVSGTDGIGGLIGTAFNSRSISELFINVTNCYATGAITATGRAGGLFGQIRLSGAKVGGVNLNISDSYSLCDMSACTSGETGGIFGSVYSKFYAIDEATDPAKTNANINIVLDDCYFAGSHGTRTNIRPIMYDPTVTNSANGRRYKTLTVTDVYYLEGSYGTLTTNATSTNTNSADSLKTAEEFADGTVAKLLGDGWATSTEGYPIRSTLSVVDNALVKIGTSIRTFAPTGMRFYFKVDTDAQIAGLKEYGAVLSKADNAANGLFVGGDKTAKAIAFDGETTVHVREDVAEDNKTYDYFTALLNFSSDKNFNTHYIARAYALYVDEDGQEIIVYSDVINSVKDDDYNGGEPVDSTLYNVAMIARADKQAPDYYPAEEAYLDAIIKGSTKTLNNTYYKLKTQDTLNVAYFGGSVTDGHGSTTRENSWRRLTSKWLESTYGVTVNEVNGAIGGTGTKYGVYRAVQDLKLASVKPDLVFVEFSVNDKYDGFNTEAASATAGRNMETIINTVYTYAPQADIVMVFTGDYDTMSGNKTYYTKAAHKAVADAYKIPTIDVATPLWNRMCEEKGSKPTSSSDEKWLEYVTDIVHPTDKGYAEYAKTVQAFLKATFDAKFFLPEATVDAYKPDTTMHTLLVNPRVDNLLGETAPDGISIRTTAVSGYAVPAGSFAFTKLNAKVTFTFTGTDLQLWLKNDSTGSAQSGTLKVTVDGVEQAVALQAGNHALKTIASGLADTEHTVTIELSGMTSDSVAGVYICQFLMAGGTSQTEGVTLVP